jgi:hypothetical protein
MARCQSQILPRHQPAGTAGIYDDIDRLEKTEEAATVHDLSPTVSMALAGLGLLALNPYWRTHVTEVP